MVIKPVLDYVLKAVSPPSHEASEDFDVLISFVIRTSKDSNIIMHGYFKIVFDQSGEAYIKNKRDAGCVPYSFNK